MSQVFSERELLNLEEETRDLNKISTMERVKEWVLSVAISACQKDYPDYQAMVKDHLRAFDSQESSEKCVKVYEKILLLKKYLMIIYFKIVYFIFSDGDMQIL